MAQNTIIGDEAISPTILNERTFGWDTSFPSTWPVGGFFIRTDINNMYRNTGSEGTPAWTLEIESHDVGLIFALG